MDTVLVVGLASVYLWYLIAHATITEWAFGKLREDEGWLGFLTRCPWCLGFWITGFLLLVSGQYDPLTHLATATVVGVVGDYIS